jgi:predicted DNA-binding transcriptional regulator AlpA
VGKAYTAIQAAKLSGVSIPTIYRYLRDGKIKPKGIPLGDGRMLWRFSDSDIEKAKKLLAGSKPGRKPKAK